MESLTVAENPRTQPSFAQDRGNVWNRGGIIVLGREGDNKSYGQRESSDYIVVNENLLKWICMIAHPEGMLVIILFAAQIRAISTGNRWIISGDGN